ncbi:hypothetical protein AMAG_19056 [Allomyces macrogynus ATCC 38327]|uniref:Uncharacterized protein n=1 Tax=Allomyces macrogynus (strain ATCC 38327) TaxID=578462 RepID=A0A0L0SN09_ALLM3|nr:hypothetical protein AMAG_19056 [Allomyces macrogynus ATCC 38327]|eukprot:KNE63765.1 hypothetical protein AMAG_19056 [Allomyces macrogynus ATCC 38327]
MSHQFRPAPVVVAAAASPDKRAVPGLQQRRPDVVHLGCLRPRSRCVAAWHFLHKLALFTIGEGGGKRQRDEKHRVASAIAEFALRCALMPDVGVHCHSAPTCSSRLRGCSNQNCQWVPNALTPLLGRTERECCATLLRSALAWIVSVFLSRPLPPRPASASPLSPVPASARRERPSSTLLSDASSLLLSCGHSSWFAPRLGIEGSFALILRPLNFFPGTPAACSVRNQLICPCRQSSRPSHPCAADSTDQRRCGGRAISSPIQLYALLLRIWPSSSSYPKRH